MQTHLETTTIAGPYSDTTMTSMIVSTGKQEFRDELDNEIAPRIAGYEEAPAITTTPHGLMTTDDDGEAFTRMPLVIDNERDFIERNIMLLQELLGLPVPSTTAIEGAKESTTATHDDIATMPATEKGRMGRGPNFEEAVEEHTTEPVANFNSIVDRIRAETTVRDPVTERTTSKPPTTTEEIWTTSPYSREVAKETTLRPLPRSTTIVATTESTTIVDSSTEERIPETTLVSTTRKLPSTTAAISTSAVTTITTAKSIPSPTAKKSRTSTKKNTDSEDIAFLKQLVSVLNCM